MQYFKIHVKRWYSRYNLSLAEQNSSGNLKKTFFVTGRTSLAGKHYIA
jgi:hypothetical protein